MDKYSVILGNLGNTCDRFLSSGYKDVAPPEVRYSEAAKLPHVSGIELVGSWDITADNVSQVKQLLADNKLTCSSIIPDLFSRRKWGYGSMTARSADTRTQAVAEIKEMIDIAADLGCPLITLWPGQDGYDYCLQADYMREREWLGDAIRECAAHRSDIKIALEYKPKEPRTHSYIARCADTILLIKEVNAPNVGVTIDVGHAFVAGENVGESIAMLKMSGDLLYHMHFNDNYRVWDDDMIVGSLHLVEYVEIIYWLRKTGYNGWYSMDQYPYREDASRALSESILFLKHISDRLTPERTKQIDALLETGDATLAARFIREMIFESGTPDSM